jgi:hypothetical protein
MFVEEKYCTRLIKDLEREEKKEKHKGHNLIVFMDR